MSTKLDWRRVAFQGKKTLDHRREFQSRDRADRWLFGCFRRQRSVAKQRGIPFHFTFEEWLGVWKDSGHLRERGCSAGSYQMARIGDVGPYTSSNVAIITIHENIRQAAENRKQRLQTTAPSTSWITATSSSEVPW